MLMCLLFGRPQVSKEKKGKVVDARCRDMTTSWVVEKGRNEPGSVELCDFHEVGPDSAVVSSSAVTELTVCNVIPQKLGELEPGQLIPKGVWTIDEIKAYGIKHGICPYFAVRRMVRALPFTLWKLGTRLNGNALQLPHADVIIYSFHYLLDPKVAEQVSKESAKDAIVVFDEAHNIDNVCIESLSIDLTRPMLDSATRSVATLEAKVQECVHHTTLFLLLYSLTQDCSGLSKQTLKSCKANTKS